jgi:hypothetical protein
LLGRSAARREQHRGNRGNEKSPLDSSESSARFLESAGPVTLADLELTVAALRAADERISISGRVLASVVEAHGMPMVARVLRASSAYSSPRLLL